MSEQIPEILTEEEKQWAIYLDGADTDSLNESEDKAFEHLMELGVLTEIPQAEGWRIILVNDWAVAS